MWLTPIFDSSGANSDENAGFSGRLDSTGYYARDFFKIDEHFGSEETFRELVDACHSRGLFVILDGVFGHWGDMVSPSPSGALPVRNFGKFNGAAFPESLDFFKEVASYWIREYKIDGWRLDQCYQLGANGEGVSDSHNYWYDIRLATEKAAAQNLADGEKWGTLGYLVGECWRNTAAEIQKDAVDAGTAAGAGLPSCFDFPSRNFIHRIMTKNSVSAGSFLDYVFQSAEKKGYSFDSAGGFKPNLFVSNHDLPRLGTEITKAFPSQRPDGADEKTYYKKHEVAMAILAAFSGPITVYYGDEWGAWLDPAKIGVFPCYSDNSSRTAGKTFGFSKEQQQVVDCTARLMKARAAHPALFAGDSETLLEGDGTFIARKTAGNEEIIVIINCADEEFSYSLEKGGRDIISKNRVRKTGTIPPWSFLFIKTR